MQLFDTHAFINGKSYPLLKIRRPKRPKEVHQINGQYFETKEELDVARILTDMHIPFLHHVQFVFPYPSAPSGEKIWCPDFILGGLFRWVGRTPCNGSVIVGIEVKRGPFEEGFRKRSIALCEHLNIPVMIVTFADIASYVERGCLPLKPVSQSAA